MFFKVWRCRGGGSRRFPVGSRTVCKFRRRRTGCRGQWRAHAQTYPKTRQIYIFSTYAPRESLFFLNITLTFSSQFVNFGLFGDNRRKGFCPCFINIFSIPCIFLHLRPLRNIRKIRNLRNLRNLRKIRNPPEPLENPEPPENPDHPEPSGTSGASALQFPPLTLRQTAAAS